MYEEMFTSVAPFGQFLAPARKFSSLVIENAGKVAEFQINSAQSYADIGLKQVRDTLGVKNAEDLQRLVTSQSEANRALAAKLLADTQALVNFGQDFGKEVQKLLAEGAATSIVPAVARGVAGNSTTTSASRKPA